MGSVQELRLASTVIDLIAMAAALWIGFYIVTRSHYSLLSWLGALTLWVLSTFFLANALLYNEPTGFYLAWLQQLVILVMPLLLHLTYLLLPDPLGLQPLARLTRFNRAAIPLAYMMAIGLILSGALPSTPPVGLFAAQAQPPEEPGTIGFMSRTTTPLFPLFVVYLILVSILSLINLWQAREQARRGMLSDPFTTFFAALALAAVGGLYGSIGTALRAELPTFPVDILLGSGVILVGIAVARYSALLEGRSLERDFIYTLIVVGSLTAFYVLVVFGLYLAGQVSFVTLVLTIVGTIAANSLFDGLRLALDRLFYRRQFQTLRRNLRDLAREAGSAATIKQRLQAILDSLCRVLRVKHGFIALAGPEGFVVRATHDSFPNDQVLPSEHLSSHEIVGLIHPEKKGLPGMKILVPLSAEGGQVGALVLAGKESRQGLSDAELDLIEDLADQTAGLIYGLRKQEENARELNRMVETFREKERALQLQMRKMLAASKAGAREAPAAAPVAVSEESLLPLVEDALRHLSDPSYLGEHRLANLTVVQGCVQGEVGERITFIERGKAVAQVLEQALDRLRPDGPPPTKSAIPPREWHLYTVLHDSYVLDEPNREIMARLYISEGTFNRTRRRALRALAKAMAEMEAAAE